MTPPAPPAEPSRSVEVELKLDVDADVPVPTWRSVPGVVSVTPAEPRSLDAHYLDTADLVLARAGVAVRRRTGGPDAGWHIKGPLVDGARTELHWPLGDDGGEPPAELIAALREWTDGAALGALSPVARIRNERAAYELLDADGRAIAEFADDHVTAWDVRAGVERAWREWELELGAAGPGPGAQRDSFLAAAAAAMTDAGARPAASASKLARTLGH